MSGLIVPHRGFVPKVASSAFSAPNATLVGDVEIGENASIWFGVILRGDGPGIRVGENSNLQDGTVHVATLRPSSGSRLGYGTWACEAADSEGTVDLRGSRMEHWVHYRP